MIISLFIICVHGFMLRKESDKVASLFNIPAKMVMTEILNGKTLL